MERFSVWADWGLGKPASDDLLAQVNREWSQDDEGFCSSIRRDDATVLQMTFEVEADDAEQAIATGRSAVDELARRLNLPGHLHPLTLYTMTHVYREE